jgi:hypothetical protein
MSKNISEVVLAEKVDIDELAKVDRRSTPPVYI